MRQRLLAESFQALRRRLGRKGLFALLGGVLALLSLFELGYWHGLQTLDHRVADIFLRWQAQARQAPADVVLIDIDQSSLNDPQMYELAGAWSWPRAIHAELIQALAAHEPRAIVVDIILSPPDRFRPENDTALAQAVAAFPRVFVPTVLMEDSSQQAPLALAPAAMGIRRLGAQADPQAQYGIDAPIALPPELWRTGYINFVKDEDGIGRRTELGRQVQGWWIPHMVGRVAQEMQFPLPRQDSFRLHWYGQSFTRIPYAQAYLSSQMGDGKLPFDPKGKIIIIGATASGLLDFVPTPLDATTPGPFVLATGMANLQENDWLRDAPAWVNLLLAMGLLAIYLLASYRRMSPVWLAGSFVLVIGLSVLCSLWLLGRDVYWMPVSALSVVALGLFAMGLLSTRLEMQQRQHVQAMFSRFLDPRIVSELAESEDNQQEEKPGSREVTMLFSDIRGFTTLSERHSPEAVVNILNRYFERQVEVIFRHGGTLDKFIGDAIMAMWGAPVAQPNHAELAVAAALEMAQVSEHFARELDQSHPGSNFDIGIGIHSGLAVVGFLGTTRRMEYTAIGDTVNVASRIEGCTKGVARVLVSADTRAMCADGFVFRDRGTFQLKGREQGVQLYEPALRDSCSA